MDNKSSIEEQLSMLPENTEITIYKYRNSWNVDIGIQWPPSRKNIKGSSPVGYEGTLIDTIQEALDDFWGYDPDLG